MKVFAIILLCLCVSACSNLSKRSPNTGTPATAPTAVQPESSRSSVGDERQRAKVHTELASQYLAYGQGGTAITEAKIAIEADPSYAPAYGLLALSYMLVKENTLAEANFLQALRLAPNDPELQNNYGWFLCNSGRPAQSISFFTKAVGNTLYPTPGTAYANMGYCHFLTGDTTQAEANYRLALQYNADSIMSIYGLAQVYYRSGRYALAAAQIRQLHKSIAPTAQTLWLGVRAARLAGDYSGQQEFANDLRNKFPASLENKLNSEGAFN